MRPKTRMMDVHQVFQEFADGTSMHGVPRIINARSITARIFWSVICLGAFGMFFWQCGILLQRYYSYPKKVNVEILQQPVPFPAVSVCNVDHLDFEIATILSTTLKEELGNAAESENSTMPDYTYDYDEMMAMMENPALQTPEMNNQSTFVDHYMKFAYDAFAFTQAYTAHFGEMDAAIGTDFSIEALSRLGLPANLGIKTTSEGGIRLKDFIINCRFMDDKCNISKSFMKIFDPYYFNCFTFNPEHILPSRSMRLRGVDYGLSLLLFTGSATGQLSGSESWGQVFLPGVEESDSALASGRGARVVVHTPNTRPFPLAEGYDIPPGFSVTIGVKAQQNVRIAGNHGNCTLNATDPSMGTNFEFTLISCQNRCIQKMIMSKCKCVDNRLSIPSEREGLPFCFKLPENSDMICAIVMDGMNVTFSAECKEQLSKWRQTMECRRRVYDNMTKHKPEAMEMCKCYPPCEDIVYDSSYSLSTLPDDPDENKAFYMNIESFIDQINGSRMDILTRKFGGGDLKKSMMKHLARLNVHIADNNIMKTTESPDYEAIRLVSDIGGQLGLWIGISVMTLFEVLQLIADVFRYLTAKGRNVGEKKMNIPNTITGPKRTYGNGNRFRIPESEIELPCEIDKLTTV